MQEFGSVWTEAKLQAIEKYLDFYTRALKSQRFKLCYIDAFAGSGTIRLKNGKEIDGSAVRALKFSFDKFYFCEKDMETIGVLKNKISTLVEQKNVEFINEDCNKFLFEIDKTEWVKQGWRGVIFLDPYAMDVELESLKKISNTKVFDIWYLFPFMAFNRNLYTNGRIPLANRERIGRIIGEGWEKNMYFDSPQLNFFEGRQIQKIGVDKIKDYILTKLKEIFPNVSEKAALLKNEKNSPQFLLCFAGEQPKC